VSRIAAAAGVSARSRGQTMACTRLSSGSTTARDAIDFAANASAQALGGIGRPGGMGSDTFGLSKRELEVLALIAQGRTNREIGDRLFISQKTVGVHVGNILAKLGVSGRVEAAAVAIRLGLESGGQQATPRPGIR